MRKWPGSLSGAALARSLDRSWSMQVGGLKREVNTALKAIAGPWQGAKKWRFRVSCG